MGEYLEIENFIKNSFTKLYKDQIDPWVGFTLNNKLDVEDFYGKPIRYEGVKFSGTPVEVYYGSYIDPFIKRIIEQSFDKAMGFAKQYNVEINLVSDYCLEIIKVEIGAFLNRMTKINNGKSVPKRRFNNKKRKLFDFAENIAQTINSNVASPKTHNVRENDSKAKRIMELYYANSDLSHAQIAERVGTTKNYVKKVVHKKGNPKK